MVNLNPLSLNVRPISSRRPGRGPPVRIAVFFVMGFVSLLMVIYVGLAMQELRKHSALLDVKAMMALSPRNVTSSKGGVAGPQKLRSHYSDWRDVAMQLAGLPADQILSTLKTQDPFGVRKFEERLLQMESDRQAILELQDIQSLFPCPVQERITLPDQRDHEKARKYRDGLSALKQEKEDFVFLFFQHLRKAGGTNFCGLAQHNLAKPQVPK